MIYSYSGRVYKGLDYCPVAFLNGFEWGIERKGHKDRFDNLYYFKKAKLSWFLWNLGCFLSLFKG